MLLSYADEYDVCLGVARLRTGQWKVGNDLISHGFCQGSARHFQALAVVKLFLVMMNYVVADTSISVADEVFIVTLERLRQPVNRRLTYNRLSIGRSAGHKCANSLLVSSLLAIQY